MFQFDSEEMLEGIREWVLVESPTYHRKGVNRMMDLAEKEMADLGARIERVPGREGLCSYRTKRSAAPPREI